MTVLRRLIVAIFLGIFVLTSTLLSQSSTTTTPMFVTLRATLVLESGGVLNGRHNVLVRILGTETPWQEQFSNVLFINGQCSILVGNGTQPLQATNLVPAGSAEPRFELSLPAQSSVSPVSFPIPSSPYAIQANVAREALAVDAAVVKGTFTSPVQINNDLIVQNHVLFVDGSEGRIGVGTTNISATDVILNVAGAVNATAFTIDGQGIEQALSWQKLNDNLYYTDGFVGVGTRTPNFNLDVQGTLNAREILINQRPLVDVLQSQLSWQRNGVDIYFDEGIVSDGGFVGIGTSDPQEKLDVRGAIRIGGWISRGRTQPSQGTIQYVESTGDFQGYTSQGWKSLIGIQGEGSANRLTYWTGQSSLGKTDSLFWDDANGLLGIGFTGTDVPDAKLDIKGSSDGVSGLLDIRDSDDNPVFFVGQDRVGVRNGSPSFPLDVNGVVNATDYFVDGTQLSRSFSTGTFWRQENEARLFYDLGNVGIGSTNPSNLLELASTNNASISFDIDGSDLFSMGVDSSNPGAFIISEGGNLDTPIFTFLGDRIGIGTNLPTANLHVSGNLGTVIEGTFGASEAIPATGAGTRLMWIPKKAAFRVGHVLGDGWNEANIGDYSVAMGYDPLATGFASYVGGGVDNEATGPYSAVPGGFTNKAEGSFSYAAGHNARAAHLGSFVWSDYQPSINAFTSQKANQFLIRASNGMAVGTSNTEGAVLTLSFDQDDDYLMQTYGTDGQRRFVLTTSGNAALGADHPGQAGLAVMNGRVGIGTTDPTANLHIQGDGSGQLLLAVTEHDTANPTASILVNDQGQVAIGFKTDHTFIPGESFSVNGSVVAESFNIRTPEGTRTLTPNPGSPWSVPTLENNNVTSYTQGDVGIGTATPNSLLELSDLNRDGLPPVITFDLQDVDVAAIGPTINVDGEHLFLIQTGSQLSATAPMVIASRNVGIGIGLATPTSPLHVSGNAYISQHLAVGTQNADIYAMNVGGALNVDRLFQSGVLFTVPDVLWETQGTDIFYLDNVGIGTSTGLNDSLVVNGTISTNRLTLSNSFQLSGDLETDRLRLLDVSTTDPTVSGSVFVESGTLKYKDTTGQIIQLSSPLARGTGNSGFLSFFVASNTLGTSDLFWSDTGAKLTVSGNMITTRRLEDAGFEIASTFSVGATESMSLRSRLTHDGNLSQVKSYTGQSIDLDIARNWGNITTPADVIGLDINLETDGSVILNNAEAIGLRIDVSSVNASTAENGNKYAALFQGGNVGIGLTNPSTTLEVAGTISANFFSLSGGLSVPEVIVNTDTLVAKTLTSGSTRLPRIGIGLTNPEAGTHALQVRGAVSANSLLLSGGLTATTMNINSGGTSHFFVNSAGRIGFGTTNPDGQLVVSKELSSATEDYLGQKIAVNVNGATPGSLFFFDQNITGMKVDLGSELNNRIDGDVTGLKIDLRDINMIEQSQAVGLQVNVTGNTGSRIAAIFQGGLVGIGTTRPSADLHVSGNILADNLFLEGFIFSEQATFNNLFVRNSATFNGTVSVNEIVVAEGLTVNSIVLDSNLVAPQASILNFIARSATVSTELRAATLNVTNNLTGTTAFFSGGVGINTDIPASGLAVSGNVVTDRLQVLEDLTLRSGTLNVNSNTFYIDSTLANRVGIGTSTPTAPLHIIDTVASQFEADNNATWGTLRIQPDTAVLNGASGVLFVPGSGTPSQTEGSGLLAVRSNTDTAQPGSHLVFVTDPQAGDPAEVMRLTESGNLGLGITAPTAKLHVIGNADISGGVSVNTLEVGTISSAGNVTFNANGGTIAFTGRTSVNATVALEKGLQFVPSTPASGTSAFGRVYVDPVDHDLYYIKPNTSTSINLSIPFTGTPNVVPFFNAAGTLSDTSSLYWFEDTNTFQVGTNNLATQVRIVSTLNNTASGNVALQRLEMNFGDRSTVQTAADFKGLDITMKGAGSSLGRLGSTERAIGLSVDLRSVLANQTSSEGTALSGFKYGAVFMGGGVGIGTTAPDAGLHVRNESTSATPFRVDAGSNNNALMVSPLGTVGIGSTSTNAKLVVQSGSTGSSGTALEVRDSNRNSLLLVRDDGNVGVGISSPAADLHVGGIIQATTAQFGGLTATTLNIGSNALFVGTDGLVGFGTDRPSGNLFFLKEIDSTNVTDLPTTGFISEQLDVKLAASGSESTFTYNKDLTGLAVNFTTEAGSEFGNGLFAPVARGVSINASGLDVQGDGKIIGLDINVTGNGGTRFAALFTGGRVGIGTTRPSADLHVSGNIQASGLELAGTLEVDRATYNALTVTSTANISGFVSANRFTIGHLTADSLTINSRLFVPEGSSTTFNASRFVSAQSLAVGKSVVQSGFTLDVSGNAFVSGNLDISGTLNVTTINALAGQTLIISSNRQVVSQGTVSANQALNIGRGLYFKPVSTTLAANTTHGILYVTANGHLEFQSTNGTIIKLSDSLSGSESRIPFYDGTTNLNDTANLFWNNDINELQVGTLNALTSVAIVSTLNNDVTGNYIAEQILMSVNDRTGVSGASSRFTGLDIQMVGANSGSSFDFGRLADGETAIGLKVDVSSVRSKFSSTITPTPAQDREGQKYAAIFEGGSVGIGQASPNAALHVDSEVAGRNGLRVDATGRDNAFVVDENGFVGLNIANPTAQWHVKTTSNVESELGVLFNNSADANILAIRNNGFVGVGITRPSSNLHVSGNTPLRVDAGSVTNALFVNNVGEVGFGTAKPSANIHVVGDTTGDLFKVSVPAVQNNALVVNPQGLVGMGVANPSFNLHIRGIAAAGTANSGTGFTNVPSWIRDSVDTTRGFLAHNTDDSVFFGVRDNSGDVESVLSYLNDFKFLRQDGNTAEPTQIAMFDSTGRMGIGVTVPSASLHVTGNSALLITSAGTDLLAVTNNRIGVATSNPQSLFHVAGSMSASEFNVSSGEITVSTLNVTNNFIVNASVTSGVSVTAQRVVLTLSNDARSSVVGLGIDMQSELDTSFSSLRRYALFSGARAYGLRVDMRDVNNVPLTTGANGSIYAAAFLGGNVGIGTNQPEVGLHVQTINGSGITDVARFATDQSDLTLRDFDDGNMGFIIRNLDAGHRVEFNPLSFSPGDPSSVSTVGKIGIGVTNPDKTLVVNGDVRVGTVSTSNVSGASFGNALFFSGGPDLSGSNTIGSENADPLWISRFNEAEDKTELRVNVGSAGDADDSFVVGFTPDGSQTGTFTSILNVQMDGKVGIGARSSTATDVNFPATVLHVRGSKSGESSILSNYIAVIENTAGTSPDSLAIVHSGTQNVNADSAFVSFFDSSGLVGKISGNGAAGGVRYVSRGADYAEYLPKANTKESIEKGDIVGVINGKVSKNTKDAQQVMVRSTAPSVAGNHPGDNKLNENALVAFFGQVPVKVVGAVTLGDYIVPSGKGDGTGLAVSPANIHRYDMARIVGRAWESSESQEMKLINTAVGFNFSVPALESEFGMLKSLETRVAKLATEKDALKADLDAKLDAQNKEIDRLMRLLKE